MFVWDEDNQDEYFRQLEEDRERIRQEWEEYNDSMNEVMNGCRQFGITDYDIEYF